MVSRYDVTVALNYYAPYISGVTESARVIAEGLAAAGLRVRVVTSRHNGDLPSHETINGVDVRRTRVVARLGKGVISPGFVPAVVKAARRSKVLMLHMPMLESGAVSIAAGRVPVIAVYHCDVTLPPGVLNSIQTKVLDRSHSVTSHHSSRVVVTSEDYAQRSRVWGAISGREVVIPPPAVVRTVGQPSFRRGNGLHVGFLGRIVEEKGLEYLIQGFRMLNDPDAKLLIAGDYSEVAGGSVIESVRAAIGHDHRVSILGFIPERDLGNFYASIDVLALPSVNPLEAFGLVQVEAMMCGVPVVASDLPGVRQPVRRTGFGFIVPPRNAGAISQALNRVAGAEFDADGGANQATQLYSEPVVVDRYLKLVEEVAKESGGF